MKRHRSKSYVPEPAGGKFCPVFSRIVSGSCCRCFSDTASPTPRLPAGRVTGSGGRVDRCVRRFECPVSRVPCLVSVGGERCKGFSPYRFGEKRSGRNPARRRFLLPDARKKSDEGKISGCCSIRCLGPVRLGCEGDRPYSGVGLSDMGCPNGNRFGRYS